MIGKWTASMLSKIVDWTENCGRKILDGSIFVVLFILNPGHTWSEVRKHELKRKSPANDTTFIDTVPDDKVDLLYESAKSVASAEEARRQTIDDKSRVLLTTGALLLTANALLLSNAGWGLLSLMPTPFIFVAVFLVLVYFRVGSSGSLKLNTIKWDGSSADTKRSLSRDLLVTANYLEPQNSFRVAIYRGAYRSMIVGLLVLVFGTFGSQLAKNREDSDALKFLKSHQELRDALTGPQGPQGLQGPTGPKGDRGPAAQVSDSGKVQQAPDLTK